jgi:hypothetical protein
MYSVETMTELLAPTDGLLWRHASGQSRVFQVSASHQRGCDVPQVASWDNVRVEDGQQILAPQLLQYLRLVPCRWLSRLRGEQLQRDLGAKVLIHHMVNIAVGAAAAVVHY